MENEKSNLFLAQLRYRAETTGGAYETSSLVSAGKNCIIHAENELFHPINELAKPLLDPASRVEYNVADSDETAAPSKSLFAVVSP